MRYIYHYYAEITIKYKTEGRHGLIGLNGHILNQDVYALIQKEIFVKSGRNPEHYVLGCVAIKSLTFLHAVED